MKDQMEKPVKNAGARVIANLEGQEVPNGSYFLITATETICRHLQGEFQGSVQATQGH